MEVEKPNEDIGSDTSCAVAMSNLSCTAETEHVTRLQQSSSSNDLSLKVRKPYTITKQREKWTEEEHRKFLEALKLYGRGWRKIEEYVGTKTAIQIRSHAQKFFSKVSRESNNRTDGLPSADSVEIPPPRPKRKPVHPYPRKSMNSSAEALVSTQFESIAGKDTPSPRSVLSVAGTESDTSGIAGSDDNNGCPSPISCTTYEKQNRFQDKVNMNSDPSHQNSSRFKLFGRTVEVTDITPKSSIPHTENSSDLHCEDVDVTRASNRWQAPNGSLQLFSYQGLPFVIFTPFNPSLMPSEEVTTCNPADINSSRRDSGNREAKKGFVPYKRFSAEIEDKSSIKRDD